MATTWNHQIRIATDREREFRSQQGWGCAVTARCGFPPEFFTGYDIFTGRSGRTGHRETAACHFHANQFAAKHGLTMPAEATPSTDDQPGG
jgi:hypothetical protein